MKRLLIAVVLMTVVLAVAAAPAFAYLDAAGGPVGAPQATVAAHQGGAGAATTSVRVVMNRGRGMQIATVPVSHDGTGVAIALLLAAAIGGVVYALATYPRQATAKSSEPGRLPAFKPNADQRHKAA